MGMIDNLHARAKNLALKCFNPRFTLIFLATVNFVTYVDRGVLSSCLEFIEDDFKTDNTAEGALNSSFIGGYMALSPLFAWLSSSQILKPKTVILIGLTVWTLATSLSALMHSYYGLLFIRAAVGIGEASFACISPGLIDDIAPPEKRTNWLAVYFMMIPVGIAAGYGIGGVVGSKFGWRTAMVAEGLLMVPFILIVMVMPTTASIRERYSGQRSGYDPISRGSASSARTNSSSKIDYRAAVSENKREPDAYSLKDAFDHFSHNLLYVLAVLGYCSYTFVLGALAFFGPKFIKVSFAAEVEPEVGKLFLGGVSVATGVIGTIVGAVIVDHYGGAKGIDGVRRSMKACTLYIVLSAPFCAVCVFMESFPLFLVFLFLGEFFLFACTGIVNGAILAVVPDGLRPWAMGLSSFSVHLLGDVPSTLLIGKVIDSLTDAWDDEDKAYRWGLFILSFWEGWALLMWGGCWWWSRRQMKREELLSPLLADNTDGEDTLDLMQESNTSSRHLE